MADHAGLMDEVERLLAQAQPALPELRRLMVELDEYFSSPDFQKLSYEVRARLQNGYKDMRLRVREMENPGVRDTSAGVAATNEAANPPAAGGPARRAETREHHPFAEQKMEEAEKLFYGGRYAEAIKYYDQVLQIEATWDRAQKHRNESENYLRTGYIPSVALPADTAAAFGKAQSAARLGRFQDAMALLNKAQTILRDLGIQRWQEGQEFEQKLQQSIDAESVFMEGQQLFNQGQIDEGIDRVETAARVTGMPKFADKAQELRKVRATIQTVSELLNSSSPDARAVAQSKAELDGLLVQYEQHPALLKLRVRLEAVLPNITGPLKDQIRNFKVQAERAQTMEAAQNNARQARQILDQARSLGQKDDEFSQLQDDIDKILRHVQRYQDELQQAMVVLNTNRGWPAAAARMSQELRGRFPNDPGVIELNRGLRSYQATITGIKVGVGIVILAIVAIIVFVGYTQVRAYVVSLTPTVTPTPTLTFTPTATATQLPTATSLPTATRVPSLTPTPLAGKVARLVWARAGCYEKFDAIQRIPAGGVVKFLPSERRFDNFSRECVLVEYAGPNNASVIGWILLLDLVQ